MSWLGKIFKSRAARDLIGNAIGGIVESVAQRAENREAWRQEIARKAIAGDLDSAYDALQAAESRKR